MPTRSLISSLGIVDDNDRVGGLDNYLLKTRVKKLDQGLALAMRAQLQAALKAQKAALTTSTPSTAQPVVVAKLAADFASAGVVTPTTA
jgi:hypothetical protein